MSGIKADIFRKKTIGISCEIIESKEEIFAVVTAGFGEFHHEGKIDFEGIVSGAEHIKSMPKIPGIFAAVQPPGSIGVGKENMLKKAAWEFPRVHRLGRR